MPISFSRNLAFACAVLVNLIGGAVTPADAQGVSAPKVEAELVAESRSVTPGKPFQIGLKQIITKNWHTYWKNPGDSGLPTTITWKLPEGFSVSGILWPIPHAIPVGPLMNYGYEGEVLLPVQITPPDTIDARTVTIQAKAQWLVCEDICIPESAEVSLKLPIAPPGSEGLPSPYAKDFEQAARAIPSDSPWQIKALLGKQKLALRLDAPQLKQDRIQKIAFFPDEGGTIDHASAQQISWALGGPQITLKRDGPIKRVNGVLVITEDVNGKTVRNGFTVSADTSPASATDFEYGTAPIKASGSQSGIALWQALLFALIGGMILNLMPCVLPILSLKVLSLAGHNDDAGRAQATSSGLWYFAGVMASFAVLALILIALKNTGVAIGWGFQFQSPTFVLVMAGLFFLLGLSLSGVFDIGAGLAGTGESFANQSGPRGSFFTGALATIAATPCTAPFMGAAVGYALSRPSFELFAVLMALGLGFALPMVVLSISGALARILPKPGPWMETLKQLLAFPLYATTAWLVWVLSVQSGSSGVLGAATVLVALGFSAWLLGKTSISFWVRAGVAAFLCFMAFAVAVPMLEAKTNIAKTRGTMSTDLPALYQKSFSEKRVAELRAQGRPVFVNFTAAWCITCKVNEQLALGSKNFHDAMKNKNVAYLKGDWTLQDPEITRVLKSFGRSGVPLYLLYPADPDSKPVVLPQLLTQSIVLGYLKDLPDPEQRSTATSNGH